MKRIKTDEGLFPSRWLCKNNSKTDRLAICTKLNESSFTTDPLCIWKSNSKMNPIGKQKETSPVLQVTPLGKNRGTFNATGTHTTNL